MGGIDVREVVAAAGVAALLAGCADIWSFGCDSDSHCISANVQGRCETSANACSFPDFDCPSGYRYGELSRSDLAGECVEQHAGPETGVSESSGAFDDDGSSSSGSVVSTTSSGSAGGDEHGTGGTSGGSSSGATDTGFASSSGTTGSAGTDASTSSPPPSGDDGGASTEGSPDPVMVRFGECSACDVKNVTLDTYVAEWASSHNFGSHGDVHFGRGYTGLLRFDLSYIPTTATIVSAELYVHMFQGTSGTTVTTHEVLESWDEGDRDNEPGIASWDERTPSQAWTARGVGVGSRDMTAMATFTLDTGYDYTIDLATDVVQQWVERPWSNFGMAFVTDGDDGWFVASEYGTASLRPRLRVTYIP